MELAQHIHNFTVTAKTPVPELDARLWQMSHEKSGARLIWLERQEENKTFSIAFQTQPWDDTGVFHILEHSVLNGSRRYPVKEPFVELLKSSLNTFLNAMTFPDKTMYPVSSRNDQDFVNLVRVYMDAVLFPAIHQKPEIFRQEGWHYELDGAGQASYKGVVFNEMKGAFSSPDSLLDYEVNRRLFPDTCYQYESGGHPAHIAGLTYEDFAAAHKRLYHPSNSYIFLDGAVDIQRVLGILDEEYLGEFRQIPPPKAIPAQAPVDGGRAEITFELSAQEELKGRARLAQAFVVGSFRDREELTAWHVLADALCGDNQAPLTRKLLESGLARDVRMSLMDGILQPYVVLEAQDLDEARAGEVLEALNSEIARLAEEGLDHARVLAALDNMEFHARQRDYGRMPQGLVFAIQVMENWLYGGDPAANLSVGTLYDSLRAKVESGWFEGLLERGILHNSHRCQVLMRPSHTLGKENQEQEAQRLQEAQSAWSPADKTRLKEEQARLEAWQAEADTPEQLAAIPMLKLSEIAPQPEAIPLEVTESHGLPVLGHAIPTGGITYLNLYFALDDLGAKELTKASFLAELLSSLETEGFPMEALQRELRSRFGQLSFRVEAFTQKGEPLRCRAFFSVGASVLDSKLDRALDLLKELLTATKWNDGKRVYELLCQRRAALAEQIAMSGNAAALGRVLARTCAEGVISEHTGGVEYLRWMKDLEENFQEKFPGLAGELAALAEKIFTSARLTLSVTSSGEESLSAAAGLLAQLPQGAFVQPEEPVIQPWPHAREGIVIPADVSFAALGGAFPQGGQGQARVMRQAASLSYLWNVVRVQGGAYGVNMSLTNGGFGGFSSYRDPSAARTLGCYENTGEFLRGMAGEDMTGTILGAIAASEPLLTPRMRGKVSDSRYWQGISQEDLCRQRGEMLAATAQDMAELAGPVEKLAKEGSVCVLGSRKHLDDCGEQLDEITVL
ncbi:MAG: hypothetical protein HFE95_02650 [Acutalibacter sp.]|jgi:Zn-dependent M16 (insulinase) family peptidase|nr:hypothetical protein [Acutalibacter sp.]